MQKVEEQVAKEAAMRTGGRPKKDDKKPGSNLTQVIEANDTGRTAEIMAKKWASARTHPQNSPPVRSRQGAYERIRPYQTGTSCTV